MNILIRVETSPNSQVVLCRIHEIIGEAFLERMVHDGTPNIIRSQ